MPIFVQIANLKKKKILIQNFYTILVFLSIKQYLQYSIFFTLSEMFSDIIIIDDITNDNKI